MNALNMIARFLICVAAVALPLTATGQDDVRRTTSVDVLQKVQPAVAVVYAYTQEGRQKGTGSGSVIDPRGYILTAKHVVDQRHIVLLGGRPPLIATLVGTSPEFDVAILRMGKAAFERPGSPVHPRAALPPDYIQLGVDSELRMGETIFNIGSPGGRGIVASRGIVSATAFTGVNPLSIALQSSTAFDEMIQFDAASNPGNSGGPLINLLGQQVGMTVSGIHTEEGIHFALPTKTLRHSIPEIMCSELRQRYVSGVTIDPQLASVTISNVAPESPAFEAGLQVGDQVLSIDGRKLRDPIDWAFAQADWKPEQSVSLTVQRGAEPLDVEFKLARRERQPSVECKSPQPGLLCQYASYDPRIPAPIDDKDRPSDPPMTISVVKARPEGVKPEDHYELSIHGLLKIEQPGRYRLGLTSDDGSRLYMHDHLVLDNNGNHAPLLRTGWVDLDAGFHPLRIEYYEDQGEQVLEFQMAKDDEPLQSVTAGALFHEGETDDDATPEHVDAE
ncbi:MAG: trypsin-like peptidase domain-containing protein [Pirellulaceae bacterium]